MTTRYQVRLYDTTGTLVDVLDDDGGFLSLHWADEQNGRGSWRCVISDENATRRAKFALNSIVEIRRAIPEWGLAWYTPFVGIYRRPTRYYEQDDRRVFTARGYSLNEFLRWRWIYWYAGSSGAEKSGYADDVMKEYVYENLGAGATLAAGRVKASGVMSGVTVQADASAAGVWDGSRAWKNLLSVLQDIGDQESVDFKLVWGGAGTAAFEFQTAYPRWGDDRSNVGLVGSTGLNGAGNRPVVFDVLEGTMALPSLDYDRSDEVNRVLALGQGRNADRETELREDTGLQADADWNVIEAIAEAPQETTASGRQAAGDAKLAEHKPKKRLDFDVLQTETLHFGKHYFVGDKLTARFVDVEDQVDVRGCSAAFDDGKEKLTFTLKEAA